RSARLDGRSDQGGKDGPPVRRHVFWKRGRGRGARRQVVALRSGNENSGIGSRGGRGPPREPRVRSNCSRRRHEDAGVLRARRESHGLRRRLQCRLRLRSAPRRFGVRGLAFRKRRLGAPHPRPSPAVSNALRGPPLLSLAIRPSLGRFSLSATPLRSALISEVSIGESWPSPPLDRTPPCRPRRGHVGPDRPRSVHLLGLPEPVGRPPEGGGSHVAIPDSTTK